MRLVSLRFTLYLLSALFGCFLYFWLTPYIWPAVEIPKHISALEAERIARASLQRAGITIPGKYRNAVAFKVNDYEKEYLEQRLGVRQALCIMQTTSPVYTWHVRWFKPQCKEDFSVDISLDGQFINYEHHLPDEAVQQTCDSLRLVKQFIAQVGGVNLTNYVAEIVATLPGNGHPELWFEWRRKNRLLGNALQSVQVVVVGNQVTRFSRYLYMQSPYFEQHILRVVRNERLYKYGLILEGILLLVGVITVIIGIVTRTCHWRCGVAPTIMIVLFSLLTALNSLPKAYANFDTGYSWSGFWWHHAGMVALDLLLLALKIYLLVLAAEWIYRRAFPQHRPLAYWFTSSGLASQAGRNRLLLGYWLIPVQMACVTLIYLLANQFLHGWVSSSLGYSGLITSWLPWSPALNSGLFAAIFEEFLFRVLTISWLKRLVKYDWLAVLIPAIMWGLVHINHSNQPFLVRNFEVTLWGIIFGYIFLRYGPLPALVAHAGYDVIIDGMGFLTANSWLLRLNFVVMLLIILLPLGLSLWWGRRTGLAPESTLPPDNQSLSDLLKQHKAERRPPALPPETEQTDPTLPLTS